MIRHERAASPANGRGALAGQEHVGHQAFVEFADTDFDHLVGSSDPLGDGEAQGEVFDVVRRGQPESPCSGIRASRLLRRQTPNAKRKTLNVEP